MPPSAKHGGQHGRYEDRTETSTLERAGVEGPDEAVRQRRDDGSGILCARGAERWQFPTLAFAVGNHTAAGLIGRVYVCDGYLVEAAVRRPGFARCIGCARSWHAGPAHRVGRRHQLAPGSALMFFPEGRVRVFLYGQPADMRNPCTLR
eukprot:Opistho-2@13904